MIIFNIPIPLIIYFLDIIVATKLIPPQPRPAGPSIPKAQSGTQNADLASAAVYQAASAGSSSSHVHTNAAIDPSMETSLDATANRDLTHKGVEISATEAIPLSAKNVIRLSGELSAVDIINQHRQRMEYANATGTLPLCSDVCRPSFPINADGHGGFTCTARTVLRKKRANGEQGTTGCTQDGGQPLAEANPSGILTTEFLSPNQKIDIYIVSEYKGPGADGQLYFAKTLQAPGIEDQYVAIKRGPANKPNLNIRREWDVYKNQLHGLNGILDPHRYFIEGHWMYLILPRMGTTFESMLNEWGYDSSETGKATRFTFSLMTACALGRTAVPIMAGAHERNVAHLDLNMGNFILGRENTLKSLHLIDWVRYVSMTGLDWYSADRLKIIKDDYHKLRRELEGLVGYNIMSPEEKANMPFFRELEQAIDSLTIDTPFRTIQKLFDLQIRREHGRADGPLEFWKHDLEKQNMANVLQVEDLVRDINDELSREDEQ